MPRRAALVCYFGEKFRLNSGHRRVEIANRNSSNNHLRSAVQWAHFIALTGIADRQWGQSLVIGAAAAGAGSCKRLTCLMTRKTANATIKKLRILLRKMP